MRLRPSAAQDRLRPGSTALPAIRRRQPRPGSTWRHARASCRLRRSSRRAWKNSSEPAVPAARRGDDRRRRRRNAQGYRDREGRRRALEPQMSPADWSTSSSSPNICSRFTRPRRPTFSTPRPRACSRKPGGWVYSRPRTPRSCAPRCGSMMISYRSCAPACRGRSTRVRRHLASWDCSRGRRTCPILPPSMLSLRKRRPCAPASTASWRVALSGVPRKLKFARHKRCAARVPARGWQRDPTACQAVLSVTSVQIPPARPGLSRYCGRCVCQPAPANRNRQVVVPCRDRARRERSRRFRRRR